MGISAMRVDGITKGMSSHREEAKGQHVAALRVHGQNHCYGYTAMYSLAPPIMVLIGVDLFPRRNTSISFKESRFFWAG